jgi:hypothetical protein
MRKAKLYARAFCRFIGQVAQRVLAKLAVEWIKEHFDVF